MLRGKPVYLLFVIFILFDSEELVGTNTYYIKKILPLIPVNYNIYINTSEF